jgi:hypothetical protein
VADTPDNLRVRGISWLEVVAYYAGTTTVMPSLPEAEAFKVVATVTRTNDTFGSATPETHTSYPAFTVRIQAIDSTGSVITINGALSIDIAGTSGVATQNSFQLGAFTDSVVLYADTVDVENVSSRVYRPAGTLSKNKMVETFAFTAQPAATIERTEAVAAFTAQLQDGNGNVIVTADDGVTITLEPTNTGDIFSIAGTSSYVGSLVSGAFTNSTEKITGGTTTNAGSKIRIELTAIPTTHEHSSAFTMSAYNEYRAFKTDVSALEVADNRNLLAIGTSAFTFEFWAYDYNPNPCFNIGEVGAEKSLQIAISGGATSAIVIAAQLANQDYSLLAQSNAFDMSATGVWRHFEIGRNISTGYMFVNGVLIPHTTSTGAWNADIGEATPGLVYCLTNVVAGYADEIRLSIGICRHTSSFTPSTVPFTADAYTKLLLHGNGTTNSDITDSSSAAHTITGGRLAKTPYKF